MSKEIREENKAAKVNRRDFIKVGAAGAALFGAGISCSENNAKLSTAAGKLPCRKLGNTGMNVSLISMGSPSKIEDKEKALEVIDHARQRGINFFDTSANYGPKSESRFGEALTDYRDEVYFSSKYESEDKPDKIKKDFERSMERMRTDYLDVAHMHSVETLEEVDTMFASGALATLVELKEQGVVRNIGITSHNNPQAMKLALERFDFDMCFQAANASKTPFIFEFELLGESNFEDVSLPVALEKGIGVLAFKITGQGRLIRKENETDKAPIEALIRYGLSLPTDGILLGLRSKEEIDFAVDLATNFTPMSKEEMEKWNKILAPNANAMTLHYLRPDYVDYGGWKTGIA
jgi:uncharacterized protein